MTCLHNRIFYDGGSMKKEKIDRINELAHKKKSEGLTPDEVLEQAELRREFLAEIKADVKSQLKSIKIID